MADTVTRERRTAPRIAVSGVGRLGQARLRPGRKARVMDLSAGGALIETDWRLLPGTRLELQLGDPPELKRVAGHLLRCYVALLNRESILYRGALAFEERLSWGNALPVWVAMGLER